MTTPDVAGPSPQSHEDEDNELHDDTLPTRPSQSIAATSPHWQTTLESLLRFPGMDPKLKRFRPGNPVDAIAFALGATDSAHTIIEDDWVAIAKRVFEIQTCCLLNAKQLDFAIDADGWVTWSPTAEWCACVLQQLQRRGFHTTCTALVAFVVRVYLHSRSWIRYQLPRGRQRHKRIKEALRPTPDAEVMTQCSMVAKGFSAIARSTRNKKIENAQAAGGRHEDVSDVNEEPVLKEELISTASN